MHRTYAGPTPSLSNLHTYILMHAYMYLKALEMHLKPHREIKLVAEAADRRKDEMELKRKKKCICISTECCGDPALKGIVG